VQVTRQLGVAPRLLDVPEIALDIDRPDDLQALRGRPGAERTREYLDRIQVWARLRPAEEGTAMARQAS
jgi:2-phospho-L-lactate guanylyltransferase (CobY/MobA/RfbA family)